MSDAITSLEVRERLVEALRLDLVGPWAGHELADERLPGWQRPSNWYLTGFLIPSDTPPEKAADEDSEDEFEDVGERSGLIEESTEERKAAKKSYFPSSMGLSFLVWIVYTIWVGVMKGDAGANRFGAAPGTETAAAPASEPGKSDVPPGNPPGGPQG